MCVCLDKGRLNFCSSSRGEMVVGPPQTSLAYSRREVPVVRKLPQVSSQHLLIGSGSGFSGTLFGDELYDECWQYCWYVNRTRT